MEYRKECNCWCLTEKEAEKFDEDRALAAGFRHSVGKITSDGQQHTWRREEKELLSYWADSGTANRSIYSTNEPKIYATLFLSALADSDPIDYGDDDE